MISKYVLPPTLPSPPSVPSTSSSSNDEDETDRLDPRPVQRIEQNFNAIIPTATITGLPYKRKKSNIFALTTDNDNLMDSNHRHNSQFITHIKNRSLAASIGPISSVHPKQVAISYNRRPVRSNSTLSTDPKSPYYLSNPYSLISKSNPNPYEQSLVEKHRRSIDNTLNRKPLRKQWGDMSGIHMGRPENAVQNGEIPGLTKQLSPDDPKAVTIHQHYYPEGHWGWVLAICVCFAHFFTSVLSPSSGFFITDTVSHFQLEDGIFGAVIIGALSTSITLFLSPVIIAICRRKSIRLIAILGGLVTALGCLFTSFATQFHQLFVSYGIIVGIGVSMIRETAVIMIGQYFKKKREFVETFVVASNGFGVAFMPLFLTFCIRSKNWRFGFQALALITFITFFLAVLYRPASLYHPQRRAILHLKSLQKRSRLREHMKAHPSTLKQSSLSSAQMAALEKPPYFDFSVLKSRTIQILICGTCLSSFGTNTPILLMAQQGSLENIDYNSLMTVQAFMGLGMVLGTSAIGAIIVKNSVECMIARQYLCQASCFMLSASLLAFTALDDYSGYVLFVWIYGFFYGGYQYSLKMFIYEKVRARNFNRAWGYVQFCQSIPTIVGIPISAFLNEHFGDRTGYYLSSLCIALGSLMLFFIDAHKKRVAKKRKISSVSGPDLTTETASSRRCSHEPSLDLHHYIPAFRRSADSLVDINLNRFNGNPRIADTNNYNALTTNHMDLIRNTRTRSNSIFSTTIGGPLNAELTCISEEIVLDNLIDESELNGCITSCNKEDKYLMYSEFENNLNNLSEEAKAIIKKRKEQLLSPQRKAMIEYHEANCPLSKYVTNKTKLMTNPLQNNSLTARQRRASFAGLSSDVSTKLANNVNTFPLNEQKRSFEKECNSCPNCGDQIKPNPKLISEIVEEEEGLEDNFDV